MDDEWLLLPHAVEAIREAMGDIDPHKARQFIAARGEESAFSARALMLSSHGQTRRDWDISAYHWAEFASLSDEFWTSGSGDLGGEVYRGIQIRRGELALLINEISGLAPAQKPPSSPAPSSSGARRGRPGTWDWEGAFAYLVARANTLDGLHPDGKDKLTASYIAGLMRDWFMATCGDEPGDSVSREKAAKVLAAINGFQPNTN